MSAPIQYAFLHGGAQGSWVWEETIVALERQSPPDRARTFALDAPGCGIKRGRATQGLTLYHVARELIEDMQLAGMSNVVLVGHSQAGQAMALMAEMQPTLFKRFVHLSCSIPLPGQTVQQMLGRGLHGSHPDEVGWPFDPATAAVKDRYPMMFCNDMDTLQAQSFLAKLGSDSWPPLTYAFNEWSYEPLSRVAATYVICLKDNILPATWQEEFARRFMTGQQVRLDAGHQAMITRPHALAEVLRQEANRSD